MSETQTVQKKARGHFEAAYGSIAEMVKSLHSDDQAEVEKAEIQIGEYPLWTQRTVVGYKILLAWGGPEYWLEGKLDEHDEPETVRFYFRDWSIPSKRIWLSPSQEATLLEYAGQFYFGA